MERKEVSVKREGPDGILEAVSSCTGRGILTHIYLDGKLVDATDSAGVDFRDQEDLEGVLRAAANRSLDDSQNAWIVSSPEDDGELDEVLPQNDPRPLADALADLKKIEQNPPFHGHFMVQNVSLDITAREVEL